MPKCKVCGTEFIQNPYYHRIQQYCSKNCRSKKWNENNKEKVAQNRRKYRLNNLEKVRESQRCWQKRNKKWVREYVIGRKHKRKKELIKLLGGKCQKCGYIGCLAVFEFHHLDPKTKEKHDDCNLYMTKVFLKLVLDGKIQLLCCRCHRELHHPENEHDGSGTTFIRDDNYSSYKDDKYGYSEYS
jgi:hypothetical protein